jgi:hypothetical protein
VRTNDTAARRERKLIHSAIARMRCASVDSSSKQPKGDPVPLASVVQPAGLSVIATVTVTCDRVFFKYRRDSEQCVDEAKSNSRIGEFLGQTTTVLGSNEVRS